MAASTEVRVPFVDVEVVKAAFAVPGDRKIVGRQGKAVLKEAAAVDPAPGDRVPAQGPVQRAAAGLDEPGPGTAGARGGQRRRARATPGFLRRDALRAAWSPRTPPGSEDRSKHLWHVLTLEYWYRGATSGVRPEPRPDGVETRGARVKQVVQNYKSGELARRSTCRCRGASRAACWSARAYSLISTGTELMKVVRGRHVDAGQGPLPSGPGRQGHAERGHQRGARHLPQGDGQAGLLHAAGLLAVRGGRAGRRRHRRRGGRRPRGLRRQRARAARRAELGAEEPLRPGAGRPRAAARGLRHRRVDRDAGRPPGRAAARRGGAGHRARADRAAGGAAPGRLRGPGRRGRPRPGALRAGRAAGRGRPAAIPRPRPWKPPSPSSPAVTAWTRCTWPPAAAATSPSSWPPGSAGTAAGSSTSASAAWTCRGTRTTRRSSTSGSPARTAPGATTRSTSSRGATTRSATCAGPSAATWRASSTSLARGRVDVEPLVSHVADFDDAVETYQQPEGRRPEGRGRAVPVPRSTTAEPRPRPRRWPCPRCDAAAERPPRPGPPGRRCGWRSSARGTTRRRCCCRTWHERDGVELSTVVTTTALSAANAQRKFGFAEATTDLDAVLGDKSIDAVFVVTRHSSHAELTRRALLAGKAVFVEKPLALTEDELAGVLAAVEESGNDRLQVGFNRRFAPLLQEARKRFGARTGPASLRYLVNAGRLDARQLVPPAGHRGLAVRRRGRALHRHGELAARGRPGLGVRGRHVRQRGPAGRAALPGRVHRHHQLRHHRRARLPQGDAGPGRGRQGAAARRLRPCLGVRRPQAVGQFAAAARPGTRARPPSWPRSSRPCGPAGRCRCRWSRWPPPRRPPSPCRPAWPAARR